MPTSKDFFEFVKKNNAEMMDLKFVDLLGSWQHCSFPIDVIDEAGSRARLQITTRPPSFANPMLVARPMPEPPPVMIAT